MSFVGQQIARRVWIGSGGIGWRDYGRWWYIGTEAQCVC